MLVLKRGLEVTNSFVSVKSNRQLTKEGFNTEFVQDAWNEWKGSSGSGFDRSKDILGLIVGQIDDPTLQEWQTLQKQGSSTTPERLSARPQSDSKSSNKVQRAIFEGLRQSDDGEMDVVETARLVAKVRVLRLSDANEGDFVSLCAEIVRGGRVEDGAKLWARLVQLASENRVTGGCFDLPKLTHCLGGLCTEVLSLCWKTRQQDLEKDIALRDAFLRLLTALCVRQIPEALNLRNKVSELMSIA